MKKTLFISALLFLTAAVKLHAQADNRPKLAASAVDSGIKPSATPVVKPRLAAYDVSPVAKQQSGAKPAPVILAPYQKIDVANQPKGDNSK